MTDDLNKQMEGGMTTIQQRIERVTKGEWQDWKKEYALPKPDGSFVDEGELYWWAGEMEAIIEALQQRLKEREEVMRNVKLCNVMNMDGGEWWTVTMNINPIKLLAEHKE